MKKYEAPLMEILEISVADIIMTSGGLPEDNLFDKNNTGLYEEEDGFYTPIF